MRLIDADNFAKTLSEMYGKGNYETAVCCAENCHIKSRWIWTNPEIYGIGIAKEALEKEPTILEWNEFKLREMDDEEKEYYSEFDTRFIWDCKLPDDGEEILLSDGSSVWQDVFYDEGMYGCGVEYTELKEGMAWMPLPKPHKKRWNEE